MRRLGHSLAQPGKAPQIRARSHDDVVQQIAANARVPHRFSASSLSEVFRRQPKRRRDSMRERRSRVRIGEVRHKIAKSILIPENMAFCDVATARSKTACFGYARKPTNARHCFAPRNRICMTLYAAIPSVG